MYMTEEYLGNSIAHLLKEGNYIIIKFKVENAFDKTQKVFLEVFTNYREEN